MAPSSVSSACSYPPRHSGELEPVKEDVFDTYVASDDARSTTIRHYMKHAVQVPNQALQAAEAIADTVYFKAQSPAAQKTTRTEALGYFYNSLQEIIKGLWSEDEYGAFEDATRRLVHRVSKATGFVLWIYRPEPKKAPLLESCLLAEPFKGRNRVQLDRMSAHFYHSVALPFSSDAEAMAIREYVTAVAIPAYNAHVMCLINSAAYHHS
ncbi:hypothetical protein H4R35_006015 [Dimargaris xerosporica]|nr:hypothetical protein H4R35_006015 [Dimargaris xerosporica]